MAYLKASADRSAEAFFISWYLFFAEVCANDSNTGILVLKNNGLLPTFFSPSY
jgi:hypothetical protein